MPNIGIVPGLCKCIEILAGKHSGSNAEIAKSKEDAFIKDLQSNIHSLHQFIEDTSEVKELLRQYEFCLLSDLEVSPVLRFIDWSLVLLDTLNTFLLENKNDRLNSSKEKEVDQVPQNEHLKGLLSISQQKSVKNLLEFVVALGILPNLIPGIGIPLERRLHHADVIKKLCHSSPQFKHRQLVLCVATLLQCLRQDTLQSIILTYYSRDLLGALFQLCYAPIKKIKTDEGCDISSQLEETSVKCSEHEKKNLLNMIIKLQEHSTCTDAELIKEMWLDRFYFSAWLQKLLKQISPSLLMWELFLFQGIPFKNAECSTQNEQKVPIWLKTLCNRLLADLIMQSHGIIRFVQSVLDRASDDDIQSGDVDRKKLEAVALLIIHNPVKHIPFAVYIEKLSSQIISLLEVKGSTMDRILNYISSSMILQLHRIDSTLAEKYFFEPLFKPLNICLEIIRGSTNHNIYLQTIPGENTEKCVIAERDLTHCIQNIHQIFISGPSMLNPKFCGRLVPFYQVLFHMFSFLQSGKSFLRSKVKDLVLLILNQSSSEEAVLLLNESTFYNDDTFPYLAYGDEGGMMIVENIKDSSSNPLENTHCDAVYEILMGLSNKQIKVQYFMNLLKELTKQLTANNTGEADLVLMLRNKIIILSLLQKMSEFLPEDLISDISQAVNLINIILENSSSSTAENENCVYGNETLAIALVILSSLVEYKNQLTTTHWDALKKCLPGLSTIQTKLTDSYLKNVAETLCIQIATHGAAIRNSKDSLSPSNDSNTFGPSKENLASTLKENLAPAPKQNSTPSPKENLAPTPQENLAPTPQENLAPTPQENLASTSEVNVSSMTKYELAMVDLQDPILPVRSHALVVFGKLLQIRDKEAISHKENLLSIFQEHIAHDDSYIYLPVIKGLSILAEVDIELVLPAVLSEFKNFSVHKVEVVLKLGEVLLKITQSLGELIVNYKDQLLHAYLVGTKCEDPSVRSSSLSNLGEVCKLMKFGLEGHLLQEVLICARSLLKTDPDLQVRRSAVMVITLLLQGMGRGVFQVLQDELKDIYSLLKTLHKIENDEVLCLHLQLALEEINIIVKDMFTTNQSLTKEIRILH